MHWLKYFIKIRKNYDKTIIIKKVHQEMISLQIIKSQVSFLICLTNTKYFQKNSFLDKKIQEVSMIIRFIQ